MSGPNQALIGYIVIVIAVMVMFCLAGRDKK